MKHSNYSGFAAQILLRLFLREATSCHSFFLSLCAPNFVFAVFKPSIHEVARAVSIQTFLGHRETVKHVVRCLEPTTAMDPVQRRTQKDVLLLGGFQRFQNAPQVELGAAGSAEAGGCTPASAGSAGRPAQPFLATEADVRRGEEGRARELVVCELWTVTLEGTLSRIGTGRRAQVDVPRLQEALRVAVQRVLRQSQTCSGWFGLRAAFGGASGEDQNEDEPGEAEGVFLKDECLEQPFGKDFNETEMNQELIASKPKQIPTSKSHQHTVLMFHTPLLQCHFDSNTGKLESHVH